MCEAGAAVSPRAWSQPGAGFAHRGHERRLHEGRLAGAIHGQLFIQRASEWLDLADGLLLGRRTYEAFARDWPQITDPDDPFPGRMNSLPKYVISNTLTAGSWNPTTVLRGDPVQTVGALKAQPGRELQIHGSALLGNSLLSAGLVDTLRLVVAPP
jgi:dihydrofolate reductase